MIRIGVLIVVAMLLPDVWVIAQWGWPSLQDTSLSMWLDPTYKVHVNALWYIWGAGTGISRILVSYVLVIFGRQISPKALSITRVLFWFYVTQYAFWLWNKNTSILANFVVYIYLVPAVIYIVIPDKKTKIININIKK